MSFDEDDNFDDHLQDAIVKEALESRQDLRDYSRQIEQELLDCEQVSIQDYISQAGNIAQLHSQISSCDGILGRMENLLLSFQTDLGSISSEILSLQQESVEMNLRLKNRQSVRGELSQFVDDLVVTELLIVTIMEAPVGEMTFLEQLQILDHKIEFLKEQSFKEARAATDVKDVLEKLKIKAVAKIREYFLQKINQFKKPLANYQIPQNAMLKYKFYFHFLQKFNRAVATEVRDEYLDTMAKIMFSYFKSYSGRLAKLQFEESASRDDLLGSEESQTKGFFFKPSLKNKSTVFSVGVRDEVLSGELEAPIIVPHAGQNKDTRYPYEMLFRSLLYALVDNACREFLFISEFFNLDTNTAQDLFNNIFGKTMSLLLKDVEGSVCDSYDTIAIFLCIHLVQRYQLLCHKRCVSGLDKYFDSLNSVLWPRLTSVMQTNIASVRDFDTIKRRPVDVRPHYITRRYAEFSAAIVGINETFPHEVMNRLLALMQEEMEGLVLRLASQFQGRKEQLLFLINNYDLVMSILMERTKDDSKESETFREQLKVRSEEFVTLILESHFGQLIQWSKEAERKLDTGDVEGLRAEERRVSTIITDFNRDWKKSLDSINSEILSSFPNLKLGTNLLQQCLTSLVQYYHRFSRVLSVAPLSQVAATSQLINIHQLMVEVKKYKPNF